MTSFFARAFVTLLFAVFALAFVAETAFAVMEFSAFDLALPVLLFDAQNFLFFPLIGLAAILAFWRPAILAVDAYSRGRVRNGPVIFIIGLIVLLAGSYALSASFAESSSKSPFEIAPAALMKDQGGAARAPIMQALTETRMQSRREEGLVDANMSCSAEILSFSPTSNEIRYCIAAGRELTHSACCAAREAMRLASLKMHADAPSQTAAVHRMTQPAKVTFMLSLFGIGLMLARRRQVLETHYPDDMRRLAIPVILAALLMMVWPIMNAAFNQNATVLYGDAAGSLYRVLEQVFGVLFLFWAFALILFAVRSIPGSKEVATQAAGAIVALLGISQYQALITYVNRTIGIGADPGSLAVFLMIVVGVTWFIVTDNGE